MRIIFFFHKPFIVLSQVEGLILASFIITVEPRLSGLTGTKGKPDNRKSGNMANKTKTNPQISGFEFITIKNNNMFLSKLHRIV